MSFRPTAAACAAIGLATAASPALGQSAMCGRMPDPTEVAGVFDLSAGPTLLDIQGMARVDDSSVGQRSVDLKEAPADANADLFLLGVPDIGEVGLHLSGPGTAPCNTLDDDAFDDLAQQTFGETFAYMGCRCPNCRT